MSEEFGPDFITLTDGEGHESELEHLGTLEVKGNTYMAFVPADMDEDDPDYGIILLRKVEENGEELLSDIDDQNELDEVYEAFSEFLFSDEDEDEDKTPDGE